MPISIKCAVVVSGDTKTAWKANFFLSKLKENDVLAGIMRL